MSTTATLRLTLAYNNSDFTRNYSMDVAETIAPAAVKQKIWDINDSIAAGTDDGLSTFFLADDYDGTNGTMKAIKAAQIETTTENIIF